MTKTHTLSVNHDVHAPMWWQRARQSPTTPSFIMTLIHEGRGTLHLTRGEVDGVLDWASGLPGWGDEGEAHPLEVRDYLVF